MRRDPTHRRSTLRARPHVRPAAARNLRQAFALLLSVDEVGLRSADLTLAAQLRALGVGVEVYAEAKKLGKQLQYADKQGFGAAIIIGGSEFDAGQAQVKRLATGDSVTVPYDGRDAAAIAAAIRRGEE